MGTWGGKEDDEKVSRDGRAYHWRLLATGETRKTSSVDLRLDFERPSFNQTRTRLSARQLETATVPIQITNGISELCDSSRRLPQTTTTTTATTAESIWKAAVTVSLARHSLTYRSRSSSRSRSCCCCWCGESISAELSCCFVLEWSSVFFCCSPQNRS